MKKKKIGIIGNVGFEKLKVYGIIKKLNEETVNEVNSCETCCNTDYISMYSPCWGCINFSHWIKQE